MTPEDKKNIVKSQKISEAISKIKKDHPKNNSEKLGLEGILKKLVDRNSAMLEQEQEQEKAK